MCNPLEQASSIANIILAGAALAALGFSVSAWVVSKRTLKHGIINDLFKDYGTPQMAESVANLHQAFRKSTGLKDGEKCTERHTRLWINYYKKEFKRDSNKSLHFHRRMVSIFYQKIAYLAFKDHYLTRMVKEMWGMDEVFIVKGIILPIELVGIPECLGNVPVKDVSKQPYSMQLLRQFWETVPKSRLRLRQKFIFKRSKKKVPLVEYK
jgi:hypothetical protein